MRFMPCCMQTIVTLCDLGESIQPFKDRAVLSSRTARICRLSVFCKKCFGYKIHDIFHFKSTLFCIIYLCVIYFEAFSPAKSRFLRAFFTILGRSDYVTSFSSFSFCIAHPAHLGIVFSFLCLSHGAVTVKESVFLYVIQGYHFS